MECLENNLIWDGYHQGFIEIIVYVSVDVCLYSDQPTVGFLFRTTKTRIHDWSHDNLLRQTLRPSLNWRPRLQNPFSLRFTMPVGCIPVFWSPVCQLRMECEEHDSWSISQAQARRKTSAWLGLWDNFRSHTVILQSYANSPCRQRGCVTSAAITNGSLHELWVFNA